MENRIKKMGEICFWIGLLVELIIVIIDKSAYTNPYESYLFRMTFLLFLVKVISTKYSIKELGTIVVFGVIAAISYFVNEKDEAVRIVVFIAACKNMELKKVLKVTLVVTAIGSAILLGLAATGIYGKLTVTANFGRGPFPGIVETRYCFGMGHPNAFQCMLFMMTTLCLYIYESQMKWYHFIILAGINVMSFVYTDSNTALLVAIASIAGVMVMKYCTWLRDSKIVYIMGTALVIAIVIFSAIGSHTGRETEFMYKLDQVLNGRFQYAHVVEDARIENWKLFAQPSNTEFFDAGFIKLFYWYGIVPGIMYVMSNIYLIYRGYKVKDYTILVIVVAYSVFMIMEAHLISWYIMRNYLYVILGYYFYRQFGMQQSSEGYFWQLRKLVGRN